MNLRYLLLSSLSFLIFLACTWSQSLVATPSSAVLPTLTRDIPKQNTATPPLWTQTIPPRSTITPTSFEMQSKEGRVAVQSINLRQGPGTVYLVMANLPVNTRVMILGKARGDEWLLVDTGKMQGWLATVFLELSSSEILATIPTVEPQNAYVIAGKVMNENAKPVEGVIIAVIQGTGNHVPRAESQTSQEGNFYAYLPPNARGEWRVSIVGVDCQSWIMDDNCEYQGEFWPRWVDIHLPSVPYLNFVYKELARITP